jgi:2-polyprenyl-6-methoxyphenol hydroxylase-like FAD-dependent oxidoreductase
MYPVAIIGGGPVGLVSSILLSLRDIPHVLFERHTSTAIHPKACGLNQRTMEIFRQIGIEEDILQQSAPPEIVGRTAWYTSFGPTGKEIVGRDAWGGGEYQQEYKDTSPCRYAVLPQIRLEPILQRRALQLNREGVFYGSEVTDVEEKQDHVVLTIVREGKVSKVEASYCIGADGGRNLTDKLGIQWQGEREVVDMVSAHIRAPISLHNPDNRNFITWFINPALGGSIGTGYLYHLGPYPTTPEKEEWLFACALNPNDPRKFDAVSMLDRMHNTLQIPDLPVEFLSLSHWYINAISAASYRSRPHNGRIFLVGDAAHRVPPWGALGLNSGVQDVYNLVWKLGFAINSPQSLLSTYNALLDTYDEERRPIGERVAKTSIANLRSHSLVMDKALGISPTDAVQDNITALDAFFDPQDDKSGADKRAAVDRAQRILDTEFHALGAEIGWFYPSLDIDHEGLSSHHEGQLDENGELNILNYYPSTIPGHHLPHAWLERDGHKSSTRELLLQDRFLLLANAPGIWEAFMPGLQDLVQLETVDIVGNSGGRAWKDVDGTWARLCGVGPTGAVLVRPDGVVAWRTQDQEHLLKTSTSNDGDKGIAVRFMALMTRLLHADKDIDV